MEDVGFPHKIDRKLSFVLGLLFCLVLVAGGTSLYLARSIFLTAQEMKKGSEQIDLIDQVHYTTHHLIEALERASLQVGSITESGRTEYFNEIKAALQRYGGEVGGRMDITRELMRAIERLDDASAKILRQLERQPGKIPDRDDLKALADIEGKIWIFAHWLTAEHKGKMEQMVRESAWRMQVIIWVYGGFIIVGGFLILGSGVFFSRAISQPLHSLAQAAREIAQGNLSGGKAPVTSRDEIGQLNHAFNIMVERLTENEERLRSVAMLEERERIAREFHDTLAQELVLLQMKLREMEMDLSHDISEPTQKALRDLSKIAERAYEDVRQAIFGLRTMVSRGLGFIPTLTEYLHEFSDMRKIAVELKVLSSEPIQLHGQAEVQLIHIIHEALTNVFKHSQAKTSTVTFEGEGTYIRVAIEDDGKGFDPKKVTNGFHVGLHSMKDRAKGVGGKLTVESVPGKGTKVIALIPWKKDIDETNTSPAGR